MNKLSLLHPPYNYITYISRWNDVDTTISTSFQHEMHVIIIIIIINVRVCYFTRMISHVHGRAPKTVLRARNLVYENT